MNPDDPHPVLLTARSAVLLIFLTPSDPITRLQRAMLVALADSIQTQLGNLVRVLCINEADHPDVVQTFGITQLPAFVLIRRGVELWRQQGLSDDMTLVALIRKLLTAEPGNDQLPA